MGPKVQKCAINWEGVKLFNCLPHKIRTFTGSKLAFKNILDQFLCMIPDQPETSSDKPGGRTLTGDSSNSIVDWLRVLDIQQDDDPDDEVCDDDDGPLNDGGIASSIFMCTSQMGPGLSPGHSFM